jgi:hypothetical protein
MSFIPAPWPVVHIPRPVETGDTDPDTNNPQLVPQTPVVRMVHTISQFGRRGSSREVIDAEYLERAETEIHVAVPNPDVYNPMDQVILAPQLDTAGDWITGTGVAYWVDGQPSDERQSPWPNLTRAFGGTVRLRRIT